MFSSAGPQVAFFTGYWLSLCQPNFSSIKNTDKLNCDRSRQESELIKVHASKYKHTGSIYLYLYCYKLYLFINTCNTYRYYYNDRYNYITITIIFINNVYIFILWK